MNWSAKIWGANPPACSHGSASPKTGYDRGEMSETFHALGSEEASSCGLMTSWFGKNLDEVSFGDIKARCKVLTAMLVSSAASVPITWPAMASTPSTAFSPTKDRPVDFSKLYVSSSIKTQIELCTTSMFLGKLGSTRSLHDFSKSFYFLGCFFHVLMDKTNKKLDFLYIVWLT